MTQLKGKGKGIGGYLEGVSEEREPVESEIKIMYIRERDLEARTAPRVLS